MHTTTTEPPEENTLALSHAEGNLPSAEHVAKTLAAKAVKPEHAEQILWLLHFARSNGHDSRAKIGALISRDASVISKLLRGVYPETSLPSVIERIVQFRTGNQRAITVDGVPLTELRITREISAYCDLVRKARTMATIWGVNQTGKTKSFQYYAGQKRDERTFHIRIAAGGGTKDFMTDAARACGIAHRKDLADLRRDLLDFFIPGDLVILDEFHQTLINRRVKMPTIERIREWFDLCGCSVLLCGTEVLPNRMNDHKLKDFLGQIDNRSGVFRMKIPLEPYREDVVTMAAVYGLPTPRGATVFAKLEEQMKHGIGRLCRQFQMAKILADAHGVQPSWSHYLTVLASGETWENGKKSNDAWNLNESEAA